MDYNLEKIEPIFNLYLANGFHYSLQKVADNVELTKKTLCNRYGSKENMERCVLDYWQLKINERISERLEYANHAVEQLIYFLYELQYCKNNETHFFQKLKALFLEKPEQAERLIEQLEIIFDTGEEKNLFQFDSDPKVFAYFFLFNVLFLLLNDTLVYTDYLTFVLEPILTESGKLVLRDIDIEQIFKF